MAVTRTRRKARKKAPVRRKKVAPKTAVKARARRRVAAVKTRAGKARAAVKRKVRIVGAGLEAVRATVKALRGPLPHVAENGAANEEQRIESSKYLPRHAPKRLFETELFVFPETYGVNRVRLLVKDPEWLFAHWDVDPAVLKSLRSDLGERAVALSRLTLRLSDTVAGGSTVILLPKSARGFYIRADGTARSYQAELGLTLPSGEFHPLASSNTVGTPRVGPSPERARARVRFDRSGEHVAEAALAFGPRRAATRRMADTRVVPEAADRAGKGRKGTRPGGASETYRR
jgi:hypothetical protein